MQISLFSEPTICLVSPKINPGCLKKHIGLSTSARGHFNKHVASMRASNTDLQGPGLPCLADGLDERGGSQRLDTAVPEARGGGALLEELEGVVGDVPVQPEYGRNVHDLEVGAEALDGHRGPGGVEEAGESTASARSSSASWPEKAEAERARTGWRSREKAEKAETKPAGRKGSSSSLGGGEEGADAARSGVTRGSGWMEGRRGKKGWVWRWRSRTRRAQEEHSETARESGGCVVAHRAGPDERQ